MLFPACVGECGWPLVWHRRRQERTICVLFVFRRSEAKIYTRHSSQRHTCEQRDVSVLFEFIIIMIERCWFPWKWNNNCSGQWFHCMFDFIFSFICANVFISYLHHYYSINNRAEHASRNKICTTLPTQMNSAWRRSKANTRIAGWDCCCCQSNNTIRWSKR